MAGTDGPLGQAGPALHDELALLVKAGLSPKQALQAATRNPRRIHGPVEGPRHPRAGQDRRRRRS
ncbi:MAG: hypothetical protein DMF89_01675 [Acidobacteria bacterium]|nr:MAG: hypothetical protein DMF90_21060 [Acidobacteriota bacterium]PYR52756.1 MAG: hypothetical protein DMF89_01675 [Acidobacteriota bacterium]